MLFEIGAVVQADAQLGPIKRLFDDDAPGRGLWNGGASFGGVIAFIFADLIVLAIFDIYRRYYGLKVARVMAVITAVIFITSGIWQKLALKSHLNRIICP